AAAAYQQFRDDTQKARLLLTTAGPSERERLAEGIDLIRRALDRYQVADNPAWWELPAVRRLPDADQEHLREEAGDLLLLVASVTTLQARTAEPTRRAEVLRTALDLNRSAESSYPDGRSPDLLGRQREGLNRLLGPATVSLSLPQATRAAPRTAKDLCLL